MPLKEKSKIVAAVDVCYIETNKGAVMRLESKSESQDPRYPSLSEHTLKRRSIMKALAIGLAGTVAAGCGPVIRTGGDMVMPQQPDNPSAQSSPAGGEILKKPGEMVAPEPPPRLRGDIAVPEPPAKLNDGK